MTSARTSSTEPFRAFGWLVCAAICLLIAYPLATIVAEVLGLTGEEAIVVDVLGEATSGEAMRVLANTLLVVVPAGLLALLIAALMAWLNERTDARIGWLANVTPLVPMFIPPIATAIGWILLASPSAGLLNNWLSGLFGLVGVEVTSPLNIFSWPGLFFVYVLDLVPFAYISLAAGFRNLDSAAEEAARMAGAGPLEMFRRIIVPSLGPSIGGALLIVMAMGFALFSTPVVIGTGAQIDVLSVEIVQAMTASFPADEARALGYGMLLLLMVALAWYLQRRMVAESTGHATLGGKGTRQQSTHLGAWRLPARAVMVGYLVVSSVLPVLALLLVSLQRFWASSVQWGELTLDNYRRLLDTSLTVEALQNSLLLGVACATVGILAASVVARMVYGEQSRWSSLVEGITRLPAAVPILVFSLAFIAAFVGEPFGLGGTVLLLVLAYVAVFFPHAVVNASAAYLQVGGQLREATAVFGIGEGRSFTRVVMPLMLPGLTAGWAFLFVLVAGDVTVAAMLAGTGNPVAGYLILDLYNNGTFPPLAALAVVTTVLTTCVVSVALGFARWRQRRTVG